MLAFMHSTAPISTNLRRWLAVHDGEVLLEPLPGIAFAPTATREEVNAHLNELAGYGVLEVALQQEGGATYFTIVANGEASMLVYDDDADRLIAVIPITDEAHRVWN